MVSVAETLSLLRRVAPRLPSVAPDLEALRPFANAAHLPDIDDATAVASSDARVAVRLELHAAGVPVGTLELRIGMSPTINGKPLHIKRAAGWQRLDQAVFGKVSCVAYLHGKSPPSRSEIPTLLLEALARIGGRAAGFDGALLGTGLRLVSGSVWSKGTLSAAIAQPCVCAHVCVDARASPSARCGGAARGAQLQLKKDDKGEMQLTVRCNHADGCNTVRPGALPPSVAASLRQLYDAARKVSGANADDTVAREGRDLLVALDGAIPPPPSQTAMDRMRDGCWTAFRSTRGANAGSIVGRDASRKVRALDEGHACVMLRVWPSPSTNSTGAAGGAAGGAASAAPIAAPSRAVETACTRPSTPEATPAQPPTLLERVEASMEARVEHWPAHYARAARAAHIGFKAETHDSGCGRYAFCLFCIHNECDPALFIEWLRDRGCIKADAWYEIRRTLIGLRDASLKDGATTWDLTTRSKVPARMPADSLAGVPAALELLEQLEAHSSLPTLVRINDANEYYRRRFPWEDVARLLHHERWPWWTREIAVNTNGAQTRMRPVGSLGALPAPPDAPANEARSSLRELAASYGNEVHAGPTYAEPQERLSDGRLALADGAWGVEMVFEIDEPPPGLPTAIAAEWKGAAPESDAHAAFWVWKRHAAGVASHMLSTWLGYTQQLLFASGSKSPHLWILDEAARALDGAGRRDVLLRLGGGAADDALEWTAQWEALYRDRLLPFARGTLCASIESGGLGVPLPSGDEDSLAFKRSIVALTVPCFDEAVLLDRAHTHRIPFSLHAKTGRVALPVASAAELGPTPLATEVLRDCPTFERAVQLLRDALGTNASLDVESVCHPPLRGSTRYEQQRKRAGVSAEAPASKRSRREKVDTRTGATVDLHFDAAALQRVVDGPLLTDAHAALRKAAIDLAAHLGAASPLQLHEYIERAGRRGWVSDGGWMGFKGMRRVLRALLLHRYAELDLSWAHPTMAIGAYRTARTAGRVPSHPMLERMVTDLPSVLATADGEFAAASDGVRCILVTPKADERAPPPSLRGAGKKSITTLTNAVESGKVSARCDSEMPLTMRYARALAGTATEAMQQHECVASVGATGFAACTRLLEAAAVAAARDALNASIRGPTLNDSVFVLADGDGVSRDAIRVAAETAASEAVGFAVTFQWKAMDEGLSAWERQGLRVLRAS